jgi:hypothetical protein
MHDRAAPPFPPSAQTQAYLQVTRSFSLRAEDRGVLPDAEDASHGVAVPFPSVQQQQLQLQQQQQQQQSAVGTARSLYQLQDLAVPPADWSLKSSVRVVSSAPFPGLTPAALCATRPGMQLTSAA